LKISADWATFTVVMPVDSFELFLLTRASLEQKIKLSDRDPIAMGQVLEILVAEYLSGQYQYTL